MAGEDSTAGKLRSVSLLGSHHRAGPVSKSPFSKGGFTGDSWC